MFRKSALRTYIESLPVGVKFTSRKLLTIASRKSVDNFIYRSVRNGFIERLARGLFRVRLKNNPPVSPLEAAAIKLGAFGKKIVTLGNSTIQSIVNADGKVEKVLVVGTDGRSSRFRFGDWLIICKGLAPRKLRLAQTQVGRILRDLWLSGQFGEQSSDTKTLKFLRKRHHYPLLRKLQQYTPEWLSDIFEYCAIYRSW